MLLKELSIERFFRSINIFLRYIIVRTLKVKLRLSIDFFEK
jgi:hypothetical protein